MASLAGGALASTGAGMDTSGSPWIRAGIDTPKPVWGLREGICFALWPGSVEDDGDGGPRGLIRIGYPILDGRRRCGLVNFVAIEPIVRGQRGFSELEAGRDGRAGRLFWAGQSDVPTSALDPGQLSRAHGSEELSVSIRTEEFANGARVLLTLTIRADRPGELHLRVHAAPGTAPMDACVLTATMGNYMRLRRLWLRDGVIEARDLWPGFNGPEFAPDVFYPARRLVRTASGDVLICATTDEPDPHAAAPDPSAPWWAYRGSFPLTQYWRKPKGQPTDSLRVRVNGRRVYWGSHNPIPGGVAFENFDLLEPFQEGQTTVFGLSRRSPAELACETAAR